MRWKFAQFLSAIFLIALGCAQLVFFMTWMHYPSEILGSHELNTRSYLVFGLELALVVGLLIVFYLTEKRSIKFSLVMIGFLCAVLSQTFLLREYAITTGQLWESWITQSAWFFRLNGLALGIGVFGIGLEVLFGLVYFVSIIKNYAQKQQLGMITIFILLFCVNMGIFNIVLRYNSLFGCLIYGLCGQTVVSVLLMLIIREKGYLLDMITDSTSDASHNSLDDSSAAIDAKSTQEKSLEYAYRKRMYRWFVFSLLIQIGFWIDFPNWQRDWINNSLPLFIGVVLINYWSLVLKMKRERIIESPASLVPTSEKRSLGQYSKIWLKDGIRDQWIVLFIGIFEIGRIAVFGIGFAWLFYSFPLVFQMPMFQAQIWSWAIAGALLFLTLRKKLIGVRIIAILLLIVDLVLIFALSQDVVFNLYSYYDGTFDTIFPFQVLLSPIHAGLVGFSFGFLLSFEFSRMMIRYVDNTNFSLRAAFLFLFFILLGIVLGENSSKGILGGRIAGTSYYPTDGKFNPTLFLQDPFSVTFWVIIGFVALILIMDIIGPLILDGLQKGIKKFHDAKLTAAEKVNQRIKPIESFWISPRSEIVSPMTKRTMLVMSCMILILVPLVPTIGSNVALQNAFALPLLSSKNGVNAYIAPGYVRIAPNQYLRPQGSSLITNYSIDLACNEYEDFQIVVQPEHRSLNGLRYRISDFTQISGAGIISKNNVQVRYVENVIDDAFPDRLMPFSQLHLIKSQNHILWITIYTPYATPAGQYTGLINFTFGDKESFALPINLNVWNFTIPNTRHLRSNYGPQTANTEHISSYLSHRINSYGIPIERAYRLSDLHGNNGYTFMYNDTTMEWTFNWTWWDTQTEYLINHGQNAFYVNCPLGMPREPIWYNSDNVTISSWGIANGKFYAALQAHLMDLKVNATKNWFPYVYVYFIDEFQMFIPENYTAPQYYQMLEGFLQIIKGNAPGVKIMTTSPPKPGIENIRQYIDIYCPVTYDYNKTEWDAALKEGKEMWMYPCVGPTSPYANSHLYNRLFEIRTLYWQAYTYGLQGFLYWSSSAFYHGSYSLGYNGWGDGWFVYYDAADHVYDSLRWQNWRDANEDYEYIWLMNATLTQLNRPTSDFDDLMNLVNQVSQDRYNYCNDGSQIIQTRKSIGDWLSTQQTGGQVNITAIGEQPWEPI